MMITQEGREALARTFGKLVSKPAKKNDGKNSEANVRVNGGGVGGEFSSDDALQKFRRVFAKAA